MVKGTVPRSESPSRRWKSPSTPSTRAPSAERPLSSVTPSVSGTASLATALLRKLPPDRGKPGGVKEGTETNDRLSIQRWCLHRLHTRRCCHAINAPSSSRDCRGLRCWTDDKRAVREVFYGFACFSSRFRVSGNKRSSLSAGHMNIDHMVARLASDGFDGARDQIMELIP